jgi:hypothetical protein
MKTEEEVTLKSYEFWLIQFYNQKLEDKLFRRGKYYHDVTRDRERELSENGLAQGCTEELKVDMGFSWKINVLDMKEVNL